MRAPPRRRRRPDVPRYPERSLAEQEPVRAVSPWGASQQQYVPPRPGAGPESAIGGPFHASITPIANVVAVISIPMEGVRLRSLTISCAGAAVQAGSTVDVVAFIQDSQGNPRSGLLINGSVVNPGAASSGVLGVSIGGFGSVPTLPGDNLIVQGLQRIIIGGLPNNLIVDGTTFPEDGSIPIWVPNNGYLSPYKIPSGSPAATTDPMFVVGLRPDSNAIAQGTAGALAAAWPVKVTDGTNILGTAANPVLTAFPDVVVTKYVYGTATAPLNGATIVTVTPAAGTYDVDVWVGYGGTAGNLDGMSFQIAGTGPKLLLEAIANLTRGPFTFRVNSAGAVTFTVLANAAGPAGSVYRAVILPRRVA